MGGGLPVENAFEDSMDIEWPTGGAVKGAVSLRAGSAEPEICAVDPAAVVKNLHAPQSSIGITQFDDFALESGRALSAESLEDLGWIASTTYQLMEVTSDKQDLSFVDKVIVLEDQIAALCNALAAESAHVKKGKLAKLNFDALDTHSLRVLGFYGDAKMMMKIFKEEDVLCREILDRMHDGTLKPGLYASLKSPNLYVFYWSGSLTMKVASRKDVACNFVRYLVELCACVYACVEGENIEKSLAESASTPPRQQRTQRLQISLRQESQDDLKLSKGFRVALVDISTPSNACQEVQLCQGLHRCAVLLCSSNPRNIIPKTLSESGSSAVIQGKLNELSASYSVQYTDLPDEDFLRLLCILENQELLNEYSQAQTRWNERAEEKSRMCNSLQEIVKREESAILEAFHRAVPSYLMQRVPWEETIFWNCVPGLDTPNTSAVDGEVPKDPRMRDVVQIEDSSQRAQKTSGDSNGNSSASFDLRNLDSELCKIWVDEEKPDHSLIFSGVELAFSSVDGDDFFGNFVAEADGDRAMPICFGARLMLIAKVATEALKEGEKCTIMFSRSERPFERWPVIMGAHIDVEVNLVADKKARRPDDGKFPWARGKVRVKRISSSQCGIKNLLDSLTLPPLSLYARLLSFLIEKKGIKSTKNDSQIEKLLRAESLQSWRAIVPKDKCNIIDDYLVEQVRNSTADLAIHGTVAAVCGKIYSEVRQNFLDRVNSSVKKVLVPLLKVKVEVDIAQKTKAIGELNDREKSNLMLAMKSRMSATPQKDRREVRLKSVESLEYSYYSGWIWGIKDWISRTKMGKTRMTYVSKELERETVSWKAVEFVPDKRDLEEVTSMQSGSSVVPSCSAAVDVIDLEPSVEKLDKVMYLKSGQALLFVEAKDKTSLQIYLCPRLGVSMKGRAPVKSYRRGFDLVAFDEPSRFMAMYDREKTEIQAYRFDESFQHADWTGIQVDLSQFSGSGNIVWMQFAPGKRELLLADDERRVRVFELAPAMMKPRHILLKAPFTKACVSPDASCLIILTPVAMADPRIVDEGLDMLTDNLADVQSSHTSNFSLSLDVYLLNDSLSHLKCLLLESIPVETDLADLHVDCKYFGPQIHLVLYSKQENTVLTSNVLEISSAAQTYELQKVGRLGKRAVSVGKDSKVAPGDGVRSSCPALDYVFHIFDKYATSPPLCCSQRCVQLHVLLKPPAKAGVGWGNVAAKLGCLKHINTSLQKLKDKGKNFSKLDVQVYAHSLTNWTLDQSLSAAEGAVPVSTAGRFIQQVICLVPLQIARAENNALKPLVNGLQIPSDAGYADAVSLANLIRFGLYDLVLADWKGNVKVISSMGKQSSGKSYLLNHLGGCLLDVAGGRCTDGVWMTLRTEDNCLYVLMDFEGLGSFERSEQEDMLLSILNAAISNVTIFNKKDFHLDKETEAIFQRFQDGVSLVKADEKLFKGLFYIAIKDVDASDVEDLKSEFIAKIRHICSKSKENFLTTMYGGEVEIAAMPPFQRPEFHDSILDIGCTIEELPSSYQTGRSFMGDLKLVIAQISARDWSPMDSKRLFMRLNMLRRHLDSALRLGQCLESTSLSDFDTQEEIEDDPICMEGFEFMIEDAGLELAGLPEVGKVMGSILRPLREAFEEVVDRKGNDEKWYSMYETFLTSLIDRRRRRVLAWLQVNTQDFQGDVDVQKLQLEAQATMSEMKHKLALCSCKCSSCFLRCICEKGHTSDHSCLGSHVCSDCCTYCLEEAAELTQQRGANDLMILDCHDPAGHDGSHDCKIKTHTCGKPCIFSGKSSNCNERCSLRIDHQSEHRCNSRQHMCNKNCSLPTCNNICAVPFELGDHVRHACHEKFCPMKCSMEGCTRTCVTPDHFHALEEEAVHFCPNEHPCQMGCAAVGVCHVQTEIVKQTRSFHGKRGDFEYEYVTEQSEVRKECCLFNPAFQTEHAGPHTHTTNSNVVHFCDIRCPACDYYCQLPIGHAGLHKTVHGNMKLMKFVSEVEEIDLLDRKYARGESGMAEMCMMHCKARGRGHTHLVPCPEHVNAGCCNAKLYDGARHCPVKCSGLGLNVPMDEMTHEAYWKYVRFMDPCEEGERALFELCDHSCRSEEHLQASASSVSTVGGKSYCTEKLWHAPVSRSGVFQGGAGGYVTDDGHRFACDHSKNSPHNVVFVIDKSGSMSLNDIMPSMSKFISSGHGDRLGCVYEAIVRFIKTRLQATSNQLKDSVSVVLFDISAIIGVKLEDMAEQLVDHLLVYEANGGTTYSCGLEMAEQVLRESRGNPVLEKKSPVVIFLSDGGNNGGVDPLYVVDRMKQEDGRLVLHTIMFGTDPARQILEEMARIGDGTFQLSLDEVQLARSFEELAQSLKPKLAALCAAPYTTY